MGIQNCHRKHWSNIKQCTLISNFLLVSLFDYQNRYEKSFCNSDRFAPTEVPIKQSLNSRSWLQMGLQQLPVEWQSQWEQYWQAGMDCNCNSNSNTFRWQSCSQSISFLLSTCPFCFTCVKGIYKVI